MTQAVAPGTDCNTARALLLLSLADGPDCGEGPRQQGFRRQYKCKFCMRRLLLLWQTQADADNISNLICHRQV